MLILDNIPTERVTFPSFTLMCCLKLSWLSITTPKYLALKDNIYRRFITYELRLNNWHFDLFRENNYDVGLGRAD